MTRQLALLLCSFSAGTALAHTTPPVRLASDREAVAGLLAGANRYFVREVKLTQERQAIQKETGWAPEGDFYRFYVGRDEQLRDVGAVAFLTEYTVHGPVRVAVAFSPDGKVKGAMVVELTEETYPWVKSLIDGGFLGRFVGLDAHASFVAGTSAGGSMTQFYGDIIGSLVQRAALLYEASFLKRAAVPRP
jgi:hypothetical protein